MSCHITVYATNSTKRFSKPVGQEMNGCDPASILPTSVFSCSNHVTTTHDDFTFHFRLTLTFIPIVTHTRFTVIVLLKSSHTSVFISISSTALSLKFSMQQFSKLRLTDHLRIPASTVSNLN